MSYLFARSRQINGKGGTLVLFAVNVYIAPVALYNPVNRRQSQACAPTHFFGGEKGFKYPLFGFIVDTAAGIRHGYLDIISRLDLVRLIIFIIGIKNHIFSFKVQITALQHGLPGVYVKIQKRLLDLPPIDFYRPDIRHQIRVNLDFLRGATEHR